MSGAIAPKTAWQGASGRLARSVAAEQRLHCLDGREAGLLRLDAAEEHRSYRLDHLRQFGVGSAQRIVSLVRRAIGAPVGSQRLHHERAAEKLHALLGVERRLVEQLFQ